MAQYLHLLEGTTLFGTNILTDIDLANSTGTGLYRVRSYQKGTTKYKDIKANSPLIEGQWLVDTRIDITEDQIELDVIANSIDQLLNAISTLDQFFTRARIAQTRLHANLPTSRFWIAERPLNQSAQTFKAEVLWGEIELPSDYFSDRNMVNYRMERVILRFARGTYTSASIRTILSNVAINNGNSNYVTIAASGSTSVTGDMVSPLRIKCVGGNANTTKLLCAIRYGGTPSSFNHIYWAKDATLYNSTALRTADSTLDGNGTNSGTRTTANNTGENLTHRWIVTSNVVDQYGSFRVFARARASTNVYSLRLRTGLTDATNYVYPPGGGYATADPISVGSSSGNALAWVELGHIIIPPINSGGDSVYALVYELYTTCSNVTGSPTLDLDGIWLFPVSEGGNDSGLVETEFPVGTGASGVGGAQYSAIPNEPEATLLHASGKPSFPAAPRIGRALWALPAQPARLYFALIDQNNRHDYTISLTITVSHELRHRYVVV